MKLDDKIKELERRVKELEARPSETHLHFHSWPTYVYPYWGVLQPRPMPYVPYYPTSAGIYQGSTTTLSVTS